MGNEITKEKAVELKTRQSELMAARVDLWTRLHNQFVILVNNTTFKNLFEDSAEFQQMLVQLQGIEAVLEYVADKRANDSYTWNASTQVDTDLKTRFNLLNILLAKLEP